MEDTYKGESPSKKLARYRFWVRVFQYLGARFYSGKILILASREGGDIPVLCGLGVRPKDILAVEVNSEAARKAQEKHPDVHVVCGDVARIAKMHRKECVAALLDFCQPIEQRLIDTVKTVVEHTMKDNSVLGVGYLSGRESGELRESVSCYADLMVELNDLKNDDPVVVGRKVLELMSSVGSYALSDKEIAEGVRESLLNPLMVTEERLHDLGTEILEVLSRSDKSVVPRAALRAGFLSSALSSGRRAAVLIQECFYYTSTTRSGKGVPMGIAVGTVYRALPTQDSSHLARIIARDKAAMNALSTRDCNATDEELRDFVLTLADKGDYFDRRVSERLHDLFNISKGTLAAWKAHRTMGTYKKCEEE